MKRISRCPKCGGKPEIKVGYDTLQIVCESCGFAGNKYCGDYYDEGFMMATYGGMAIKAWNKYEREAKL